jgi:arginase
MDLDLIVVPYESGRRGVGVGAGPLRLLDAGIADQLHAKVVEVVTPEAGNGREISASFALMVQVARAVATAREAGRLPIVLSGNCGVAAVGAAAGLDAPAAIVWLDAHGDLNTPETTLSGFFDGMALSILLGRCWRAMASRVRDLQPVAPEHVVLVGARDLDPAEAEVVARGDVRVVAPDEFRSGLGDALRTATANTKSAYVHVDLDVLDLSEGRANAYAAAGGLTVDEVVFTLEQVASVGPIGAVALTAYDPTCDPEGGIAKAGIRIARAAAELRPR